MRETTTEARSHLDLEGAEMIHDSSPAALYEFALARGEARLARHGPLVVDTGRFTGRSPRDKFIVRSGEAAERIDWGEVNQPISREKYETLKRDMEEFAKDKQLFVQDLFIGADPRYRRKVRVITEYAWHSLFAQNMFIRSSERHDKPDWTVLDLPSMKAQPTRHGTRSDTAIVMDLEEGVVLVANTEYAGEIKKSVFSAMNFELPGNGVMPMHCSANSGRDGDVALFFGLSGTGKTTLSSEPSRVLIGDDEHGWSADGVFNFEGGCYAKVIDLDASAEPEIFATTRRFGTILENVGIDPVTREVDLSDRSLTENTRAAYPIDFIPNASDSGTGGHPRAVIFLTADAFGVLPPISRLDVAQAKYHFLSGYTAKVAGTERGVTEPQATFSTCFGAPFMPLHPNLYAEMLGERLERHGTRVWLLNTGWTGGPHGVGRRIRLPYTRAMVDAALSGSLDDVPTRRDPIFGLQVPVNVAGVPQEILDPRSTWDDPNDYDRQAWKLAAMFRVNFEEFEGRVAPEVQEAGPAAP
ncbi:MAG TPA: phosphoenolpyruvate carboxykinase (ATP) [Trueperaceae bacterium]